MKPSLQALYIIQSNITGAVKVGRGIQPSHRIKELQTGSPYQLKLLAEFPNQGHMEMAMHQLLAPYRLKSKGEWFSYDCLNELPDWIYRELPTNDRWWKH